MRARLQRLEKSRESRGSVESENESSSDDDDILYGTPEWNPAIWTPPKEPNPFQSQIRMKYVNETGHEEGINGLGELGCTENANEMLIQVNKRDKQRPVQSTYSGNGSECSVVEEDVESRDENDNISGQANNQRRREETKEDAAPMVDKRNSDADGTTCAEETNKISWSGTKHCPESQKGNENRPCHDIATKVMERVAEQLKPERDSLTTDAEPNETRIRVTDLITGMTTQNTTTRKCTAHGTNLNCVTQKFFSDNVKASDGNKKMEKSPDKPLLEENLGSAGVIDDPAKLASKAGKPDSETTKSTTVEKESPPSVSGTGVQESVDDVAKAASDVQKADDDATNPEADAEESTTDVRKQSTIPDDSTKTGENDNPTVDPADDPAEDAIKSSTDQKQVTENQETFPQTKNPSADKETTPDVKKHENGTKKPEDDELKSPDQKSDPEVKKETLEVNNHAGEHGTEEATEEKTANGQKQDIDGEELGARAKEQSTCGGGTETSNETEIETMTREVYLDYDEPSIYILSFEEVGHGVKVTPRDEKTFCVARFQHKLPDPDEPARETREIHVDYAEPAIYIYNDKPAGLGAKFIPLVGDFGMLRLGHHPVPVFPDVPEPDPETEAAIRKLFYDEAQLRNKQTDGICDLFWILFEQIQEENRLEREREKGEAEKSKVSCKSKESKPIDWHMLKQLWTGQNPFLADTKQENPDESILSTSYTPDTPTTEPQPSTSTGKGTHTHRDMEPGPGTSRGKKYTKTLPKNRSRRREDAAGIVGSDWEIIDDSAVSEVDPGTAKESMHGGKKSLTGGKRSKRSGAKDQQALQKVQWRYTKLSGVLRSSGGSR